MVPYIGSAAKVSEVLSGRRELSKAMIRNLVDCLGIPAEVLLQESGAKPPPKASRLTRRHFPMAAMVRRGLVPT